MGWCEDWISSPLLSTQCALDHCNTVRTQGQVTRGDTQNVLWPHLHERGIYFMKLYWSNNEGNKQGAHVRVCEWLIMKQLELIKALHFKMISCCPCRWQQRCTHWCGQGRAAITRLDTLVCQVVANIDSFSSFLSSEHLRKSFMWITQCVLHHNEDSLHFSFIWAL